MTAVVLAGGSGGAWAWTAYDERARAVQARDRVEQAAQARAQDEDAATVAESELARAGALGLRSQARATLDEAVGQGRAALDASDGQVDDGVRQALGDALDRAQAAGDESGSRLRALAAEVAAATTAVTAAHDAWIQEAARAEALAAAEREAAARAAEQRARAAEPPRPSTQQSCETTYDGPPFYTSPPTPGGDGSNGKLPPDMLTAISWATDPHGTPYYLRNDAAAALERLDRAFVAQFGHHLDLDLTYRDYDTQVAMLEALGTVAAVPGTSSHGTGLAIDVPELPCEYGWDTPQRDWLVSQGPSFGWTAPGWAQRNGSNPEYWHFEYVG